MSDAMMAMLILNLGWVAVGLLAAASDMSDWASERTARAVSAMCGYTIGMFAVGTVLALAG